MACNKLIDIAITAITSNNGFLRVVTLVRHRQTLALRSVAAGMTRWGFALLMLTIPGDEKEIHRIRMQYLTSKY